MSTNTKTAPPAGCPECGGGLVEERCGSGPHFAKLICPRCRRHVRWMPRPSTPAGAPPPELLELARRAERPLAKLRAVSRPQVSLASSCRAAMLRQALARGDRDRAAILRAVSDASWFCANGASDYSAIRWPTASQLNQETHP